MKEGLSDADFSMGRIEAWDKQERENLKDSFFLPTAQFSMISGADKIFLCGRRGSGKSAIALMLECESNHAYKEAIQGEIEEYGAYMDVVNQLYWKKRTMEGIDIKQAVRRLWLWVLPLKAMQTMLIQAKEQGEIFDDDLITISNYFKSLPPALDEDSRIGDLLSNIFAEALLF